MKFLIIYASNHARVSETFENLQFSLFVIDLLIYAKFHAQLGAANE